LLASAWSLAGPRWSRRAAATRRTHRPAVVDTLGRFLDRPILDLTTLEGRYDIWFPITPEEDMPMMVGSAVNAGITLPPQALQLLDGPAIGSVVDGLKAVGLLLQARKAPLDMLVVDSIERTPTEN